MTWIAEAKKLIEGAERARLAGDDVAFIALATKAAECAQIARLLSEPGLTRAEQIAQGQRCDCRGSDDYCPCQNSVSAATRRERTLST